MLKNILSFFMILQLILNPIYANTVKDYERTKADIDDFLKNANPSNIPFADFMSSFIHEKSQPLQNFDLTKYKGKQIYVGYGIFDQDQKYCKYVEHPDLDPTRNGQDVLTNYFTNISSFNSHQYAVSINKMNYTQCKALVEHFGGYVATPTSLAENGYLSNRFSGLNKWIGVYRENCSNSQYYNEEGKAQEFLNWYPNYNNRCYSGRYNVELNKYGYFTPAKKTQKAFCLIEVDSPDINRPHKICAPWWRIERDYRKMAKKTFGGVDVYRINQADIPAQTTVCTKMNKKKLDENKNKPNRQITCTQYYDSTVKPECLHDPMQPQCFVDECIGYIKNACSHVQEITPYKDYTKTKAMVNGQMKWIKGKTHIRTEIYSCPPSPPSKSKYCTEQSTVITFPKECPQSHCTELKDCVFKSKTKDEKNRCYNTFKCNKIYGSPDMPVYDANGKLIALKGYCKDDTGNNIEPPLEFPINIQNKKERKCLEYSTYLLHKQIHQNCLLERPYDDYQVDMAITDKDIYEDNPDCIRLNNLTQARPLQEMALTYKANGFAKTVIKKAYINGKQEEQLNDGIDYVITPTENASVQTEGEAINNISANGSNICPEFDKTWWERMKKIVTNNPKSIESINSSEMKAVFSSTNYEYCDSLGSFIGGNAKYKFGKCEVVYNKQNADKLFSLIKIADRNDFYSQSNTNKEECERRKKCLGGSYNESSFSDGGKHQCVISTVNRTREPSPPQVKPADEPKYCGPAQKEGAITTKFDGNKDIFYIEEVTDGPFGYYSNYTTLPYKNNVIKYQDKELAPIKRVSVIDDGIVYEGIFEQISILTSSPNIVAGAIGGTAAGGAAALYTSLSTTGIGLVAVAVFVVIAILFASETKYNEQYGFWEVYKYVPISKYVDNIYNYDYRLFAKNDDGTRKVFGGDKYKLIYATFGEDPRPTGFPSQPYKGNLKSFTGTLEPPDFRITINNWFKRKQQLFMCLGWDKSAVPVDTTGMETGVVVSYPHCGFWDFWCDKHKSNGSSQMTNPLVKKMTNYYKGAVNTVNIVVPFLGDYKLEAYDAHNNKIGDTTVYQSEFIKEANGKASYAQAMFGLDMDLAYSITDGNKENACRFDLMVEWGGGVSGIYYENGYTGMYKNCQKSNDIYVQDHSATKLVVKPLNSDKGFEIKLDKPMPFANRVFLVTLGEKEIRKYRCYKDFGDCDDIDYTTTEGNE